MSLPYVLTDAAGTRAYALNATFLIPDHSAGFNWGMQAMPRAHGGRANDRAYLNPRTLSLRGYVGAGSAGGSLPMPALTPFVYAGSGAAGNIRFFAATKIIQATGANFTRLQRGQSVTVTGATQAANNQTVTVDAVASATELVVDEALVNENNSNAVLTASMLPITEVQFLAQLHDLHAFFLGNQRAILDYRNGFIQYVLVGSVRNSAADGWPDLRAYDIELTCEDPFGYGLELLTGSIINNGGVLSLWVPGDAPSRHYRLALRSNTDAERDVKFIHANAATTLHLRLPARSAPAPLTLHGWQRVLYVGTLNTPAWSRLLPPPSASAPPNIMPLLRPGTTNAFAVFEGSTGLTLTDLNGTDEDADVQVQLTAHSAVWLPDSFQASANLPAGQYDISLYDVAVYGP